MSLIDESMIGKKVTVRHSKVEGPFTLIALPSTETGNAWVFSGGADLTDYTLLTGEIAVFRTE